MRWRTRSWPRCGRARWRCVYLREAYGGLAGFLTGWTSFIAGFAGAIAANAMIVPFYLERFAPGAASSTPWLQIPLPYLTLTLSTQGMIAIAIVWLLAMIHIRGVGPGRVVSNALTILKVVALLGFIAVGLAVSGAAHRLRLPHQRAPSRRRAGCSG